MNYADFFVLVCVVAAVCKAFGMTVKGLTRTKRESTISDFDVFFVRNIFYVLSITITVNYEHARIDLKK